jgi:uncharacterized protein (DUF362 family)
VAQPAKPPIPAAPPARVSITTGDSRADQAFQACRFFEKEIAQAIGDKRIVVKPNFVATNNQLAATHAETIEGILEFLKSIKKLENAVIAESAAPGPAKVGYDNYRYPAVADKYGVKLVELDEQPFEYVHVLNEADYHPRAVRMSKWLLDNNSFVISAARMKTHDRVLVTLSLKNIVLGAPIRSPGGGRPAPSDKPIVHGGNSNYAINYNLFALAPRLHPHLSVIEGFQGMEGNGPVGGTPVEHRVCVAGLDWLAADRVAAELMGVDFAKIGYLTYAADAQLGQADLGKIEVLGEPIAKHIKPYKLATGLDRQLNWMKPPQSRG